MREKYVLYVKVEEKGAAAIEKKNKSGVLKKQIYICTNFDIFVLFCRLFYANSNIFV